jgi:hypothetical protein
MNRFYVERRPGWFVVRDRSMGPRWIAFRYHRRAMAVEVAAALNGAHRTRAR